MRNLSDEAKNPQGVALESSAETVAVAGTDVTPGIVVLTDDEQVMEIEDCIDESTEYYVICDRCRGVTDVESMGVARDLFDQGWRMVDNGNRMLLTCPTCAAPSAEGERP